MSEDATFFQFKHFKLRNENAVLKINTDGVLLGAWCNITEARQILDVGTGSGVIAIIIAHKAPNASVTAIDIDLESFVEAQCNFKLNNFNISCFHKSLQNFFSPINFDHIISNLPFFDKSTKSTNYKMNISKHTCNLNHEDFWQHSSRLTSKQGKVSVIIPFDNNTNFDLLAKKYGFGLTRQMDVCGIKNGPIIRSLKEYQKQYDSEVKFDNLYIREDKTGRFGDAYRDMCQDLYIKF